MWAAHIDLLVGRWRVGVRCDTDATRRELLALLGPYVDTSGEPTRTNFGVHVERGRFGRRGLASLYVAGDLVLDGARLDVVARRLAGHLAGVAVHRAGDPGRGRTSLDARLAVRGHRAVLVATTCTGEIDIADADIAEMALWHPVVEPGTSTIVTPPPLADLGWGAARLEVGWPLPARLELVGLVAPRDLDGGADLASVWFSSRGALDDWGLLLAQLDQDGRVEPAPTNADVPAAVRRLLM